jgi:hypothetical protein
VTALTTVLKGAQPAMNWVTRARPRTERIAFPWLIRRFIDPTAEFLYVDAVYDALYAHCQHTM